MSDKIEAYRDEAGEWRWHRRAANGEIVSDSGEGYKRRIDMLEMAERLNPDIEIVYTSDIDDDEE